MCIRDRGQPWIWQRGGVPGGLDTNFWRLEKVPIRASMLDSMLPIVRGTRWSGTRWVSEKSLGVLPGEWGTRTAPSAYGAEFHAAFNLHVFLMPGPPPKPTSKAFCTYFFLELLIRFFAFQQKCR